jgi:hypothetical protein
MRNRHRLVRVPLSSVPSLTKPLRLVIIAGKGRSGSTLLGQVLSDDPDVVFVGEASIVWRLGYVEDRRCSCGEHFHACALWSEVDAMAFGGLATATAQSLHHLERGVVRKVRVPWLLTPGLEQWPGSQDLARLVAYRSALYRAVASTAQGGFVVDTSKDPVYGMMLSHLERVELHVIHLVRDPRAVAFSWQRKVARTDMTDGTVYLNNPSVEKTSMDWVYRNLLAGALRRRATTYQLVRYEDFVAEPDSTIARIRNTVGLPAGPPVTDADGVIRLSDTGHAMGGNPRRRTGGTEVVLRLDDEWRRSLSKRDERAVVLRCAPLMRRYGY